MAKEYWWLNEENLVEFDGPFKSAKAAEKGALGVYEGMDDAHLCIVTTEYRIQITHKRELTRHGKA